MDFFANLAVVFQEAHAVCDEHRREMCRIVTETGSDEKILANLRDSILKYRART